MIQFDEPAFNVYMDQVRDWGIKALDARRRGPHLRRPPCTSATATASRPTPIGKKPSAAEWRQYEETFPVDRQEHDPAGRDRVPQLEGADSSCSRLLPGKIVQAGVIDVASDTRLKPLRMSSR